LSDVNDSDTMNEDIYIYREREREYIYIYNIYIVTIRCINIYIY